MSRGYVYILSNECMPGIIKVGRTSRDPATRAGELYNNASGVPVPFSVNLSVFSPDCVALEAMIHAAMDEVRVSQSREFFRADVSTATWLVEDIHREQINEWLSDFLPDHVAVHTDEHADLSSLADTIMENPDVYWPDLKNIVEILRPVELAPAIARWKAAREAAK